MWTSETREVKLKSLRLQSFKNKALTDLLKGRRFDRIRDVSSLRDSQLSLIPPVSDKVFTAVSVSFLEQRQVIVMETQTLSWMHYFLLPHLCGKDRRVGADPGAIFGKTSRPKYACET